MCAMFYELIFLQNFVLPLFFTVKKWMDFFSRQKVFFNAIYNGKKVGQTKKIELFAPSMHGALTDLRPQKAGTHKSCVRGISQVYMSK